MSKGKNSAEGNNGGCFALILGLLALSLVAALAAVVVVIAILAALVALSVWFWQNDNIKLDKKKKVAVLVVGEVTPKS